MLESRDVNSHYIFSTSCKELALEEQNELEKSNDPCVTG